MIFNNFGQNTAKFYDNHILLTMICIFLSEFGLKSHCKSTEKGKVFLKHCPPLDTGSPSHFNQNC